MTSSIVPIVEGQSEVEAIPVILRRLLRVAPQHFALRIEKPVRVKRYKVIRPGELERAIALTKTRPNCKAIMIVLDADEDCPKELGPSLLRQALTIAPDIAVSAGIPKVELEAWFVGSLGSLRGVRGISMTAQAPPDPESIQDAKGFLTSIMVGHSYVSTDDQPAFAERFDFDTACSRCRSFRKFRKDFEDILHRLAGQTL